MSTDLDATRIVRSWLHTDEHESADRVLDSVLVLLDATPQHRSRWPVRRFAQMNSYAKLAIAAAAVVAVALVGINLLPPSSSSVGGAGPAASPSASPTPSASPSASTEAWHVGAYGVGRYEATLEGVPFSFSFAVPSTHWSSYRFSGMLETGTYPTANYAWIGMPSAHNRMVGTDPCAAKAKYIGGDANDLAIAETKIPGTHATGPTDVTIGGVPAKLVVLTIDPDIACAPSSFMLSGEGMNYPNSLESTIQMWFFERDGKTYEVYSDQAGNNQPLAQEIEQIVESIQFE